MSRLSPLFATVLLLAALCSCSEQARYGEAVAPPPLFTALIDGSDLAGWWGADTEDPSAYLALPAEQLEKKRQASQANIHKHWVYQNGDLVNDGEGLYLTSEKNYGDIELLVDYRTVAKADSGVYLRGTPQVQIWDYTKEGGKWDLGADKGSGGLWNNAKGSPGRDPLVLADKPFGEWNHLRIIMVGERVTVYLNEKLVVDFARLQNYFHKDLPLPRSGPIQLQTHGGEIRWRNIFVRPIGVDEAITILRNGGPDKAPADNGFVSIFNGQDFTGWDGPIGEYEVKEGAIVCRPNKGGTIFTKENYADFIAKVEFRLPPAGNNGLAIRYPGYGDTAYVGMCELQVLDSEDPSYAKLDPRQYHGSIYGQVAAHRGYLNKVNEWNYEEATIQGSRIKVELNGTVILDADVANITSFLDNKLHPGKDRKDGHFGLAGHNDPVAFRNMRIKRLLAP
jgi:hypothetical protein